MRVIRFTFVAVVALCSLESLTLAATPEPKIVEVKFTDADTLKTSSLSPDGMIIPGGPKTIRTILTRPRTTFVPELLTSIQNL
jgi:hypothetical protein